MNELDKQIELTGENYFQTIEDYVKQKVNKKCLVEIKTTYPIRSTGKLQIKYYENDSHFAKYSEENFDVFITNENNEKKYLILKNDDI